MPLAVAEDTVAERRQQLLVELVQVEIGLLVGPAREEHRQLDGAALELALVDEPRAGLAQRGHGGGARLLARERRGRARLVVVLDEADESLLVPEVGVQVPVHGVGAVVHEAVVEPLVVAVVEALLLQRPLEIPVGLGHEHEAGMGALHSGDHGRPVVGVRSGPTALTPRALEGVVHHQHRHVAAHAVALRGDRAQRLDHGRTEVGRERVQLHDVGPGGEVRVAAVREHAVADADERRRIPREILVAPAHEVLRVRLRPRVVGRDVVRHEVEKQTRHRASASAARAAASPDGPPRWASTV